MNFTTTVKLSEAEISEILTEYFAAKNLKPKSKIRFNTKTIRTGYGPMERDETIFDGVSFETEISQ